ncbi:hypothetical protein E1301_Tti012836 [Triplophysa tibetana]|uniref:Uncharacterized protein n=1 Tax=Triplophysa tibetana TaxID=1572043 RepID=A0A5A9NSY3_9TELE|nr:hypothetical protein E1301_Tti012836 [Triplophysa tibetana]
MVFYDSEIIKINKLQLVKRLNVTKQTRDKTAEHFTLVLTTKDSEDLSHMIELTDQWKENLTTFMENLRKTEGTQRETIQSVRAHVVKWQKFCEDQIRRLRSQSGPERHPSGDWVKMEEALGSLINLFEDAVLLVNSIHSKLIRRMVDLLLVMVPPVHSDDQASLPSPEQIIIDDMDKDARIISEKLDNLSKYITSNVRTDELVVSPHTENAQEAFSALETVGSLQHTYFDCNDICRFSLGYRGGSLCIHCRSTGSESRRRDAGNKIQDLEKQLQARPNMENKYGSKDVSWVIHQVPEVSMDRVLESRRIEEEETRLFMLKRAIAWENPEYIIYNGVFVKEPQSLYIQKRSTDDVFVTAHQSLESLYYQEKSSTDDVFVTAHQSLESLYDQEKSSTDDVFVTAHQSLESLYDQEKSSTDDVFVTAHQSLEGLYDQEKSSTDDVFVTAHQSLEGLYDQEKSSTDDVFVTAHQSLEGLYDQEKSSTDDVFVTAHQSLEGLYDQEKSSTDDVFVTAHQSLEGLYDQEKSSTDDVFVTAHQSLESLYNEISSADDLFVTAHKNIESLKSEAMSTDEVFATEKTSREPNRPFAVEQGAFLLEPDDVARQHSSIHLEPGYKPAPLLGKMIQERFCGFIIVSVSFGEEIPPRFSNGRIPSFFLIHHPYTFV